MTDIKRKAKTVWNGGLRDGNGQISTDSGVLQSTVYSFGTRFEDEPGTNPEELIAAAHAACYGMAFANTLSGKGYQPERIETQATCTLSPQKEGGFKITRMHLQVHAQVPDIDQATLEQIAHAADSGCPVSNLLRCGLEIELDVTLAHS